MPFTRAIALLTTGRHADAAAAAERGKGLARSNDAFVYEVAARAHFEIGKYEDAIRWARARTELAVNLTARPNDTAAKALHQTLDERTR